MSLRQVMSLLEIGEKNRAKAATSMNAQVFCSRVLTMLPF